MRSPGPSPTALRRPRFRYPCRPGFALLTVCAALTALLAAGFARPAPAAAHDATSKAYAEVTGDGTHLRARLDLEYDLLMKSAWLYAEAYEAKGRTEQLRQLTTNADAVTSYVTDRFVVTRGESSCAPRPAGSDIHTRGSRPYAVLMLDYDCPEGSTGGPTVSSALFPDSESFVHSTPTIVRYDIDGQRGSQVLTAHAPTLEATAPQRSHQVGEFFLLGAEHLLFGLDHILFLLSLLIGARGLRDILLSATAFTAAHSVTFLLAAMGVVQVPGAVVEPVIAASIAVVAIAGLLQRDQEESGRRWRLPVVFVFGLVHGLGFAGALGIDERWSWELLLSLLSFNVGIEAVQLAIIALVFPPLLLLRRIPAQRWLLPAMALPIVTVSLYWLWDRVAVGA